MFMLVGLYIIVTKCVKKSAQKIVVSLYDCWSINVDLYVCVCERDSGSQPYVIRL